MEKAKKSNKRLKTAKELQKVVTEYYIQCISAKANGIPVGWMPPMNGAIEIFYAMGLQPVFPENWSPVCAAFGLTPQNFDVSEQMGYSRDLCGYLRNITGYKMDYKKLKHTVILSDRACALWDEIMTFRCYKPVPFSAAEMDVNDPIRALAMKSLMSYPLVSCVSIAKRKEMVLKACKEYAIDGVVFHCNKSCVPITLGQMEIKRKLENQLGIPSVIIDADHMDKHNFSVAQFQTRVDAFMEMLLEKKNDLI